MKKSAVRIITLLLLAVFLASCSSDITTSLPPVVRRGAPAKLTGLLDPDSEIRGVWIASVYNIDFPSAPDLSADSLKKELDDIIDNCKKMNLNTVFFQVRPTCDALYDSDIFPVSRFLSTTGEIPLDPLGYLLSEAKKAEIFVYAWVNPLRVTVPGTAVDALPQGSPARLHPELTVEYGSGVVFNAGEPEARRIAADGVGEIVKKYDVDGVVFDDYFYPYPANDENGVPIVFDDAETYEKYGSDFASVGDFRRDAVNKLISECHDAVKDADPDCLFGVSPFGIWRNSVENGGAGTLGFEAYESLFCDAVAWVRSRSVDFLCPQIYWRDSTPGTPYDVLVDWWNRVLGSGGVDLLISHAAYRYEEGDWDSPSGEMADQVDFARTKMAYRGSVFYGYDELKKNAEGISDEVARAFEREIVYLSPASDGSRITVSSHENYSTVTRGSVTLSGHSDPSRPLYLNGEPVGREKSGDFSVTVDVGPGENRYNFTQRGDELLFVLYG